jgi:glutaminyl-peptide cyclotransferase
MTTKEKSTKLLPDKRWILLVLIVLVAAGSLIWLLSTQEIQAKTFSDSLTPLMTYEVVNTYPHDTGAFTQGLILFDGYLYESIGLYGESSLRKVELESGLVLQQVDLPAQYFAEGLTVWEDRLIQLTWREKTGFIYDINNFSLVDQFNYPMEGWGLTQDGKHLIMSDGTANLYFISPTTYEILREVTVRYQGREINNINELEYIDGEVFANIWMTDQIVRIDPNTGNVVGWIDLSGLLADDYRTPDTDVLNGIAFDPETERLFVTGKRWPLLFEIRLIPIEP